jgi:rRNA maturation endonuclease Nob1
MEKTHEIVCEECETELTVVSESASPVQFCPFCGEYIDEDYESDEDDWNEEEE